MYPILFEIGPFTLQSLWLFVTIGFIVGILAFAKTAKRQRLDLGMLFNHGISILIVTLLVSRLTFFLANLQYYMPTLSFRGFLSFFFIIDKGLSFWGAMAGMMIMLGIISFKRGESILKWLDALIIPLGTGMIIANFGQLLDGQAYGTPTNLPWGITYESINVKYTVPVHPTQIYSMLYVAGIISILKNYRKHPFLRIEGNQTLLAVTIYSFIRFFIEFLRGDDMSEIFGIKISSAILAVIFFISGYSLYKRIKSFKRNSSDLQVTLN